MSDGDEIVGYVLSRKRRCSGVLSVANSSKTELRSNLRKIYADAIAFSVMVGAGETYLAAFVLALGMGEISAGLIASIPMLAGAVVQLVSPAAVRKLRSHRSWVVISALIQAASFVPLIVGAIYGWLPQWAVFVIAAVYWGSGMATGPAWNTWVSTLVPASIRTRYFADRSRAAHVAVLAGVLAGGALLHFGNQLQAPLLAFALLFLIAGACRFISAGLLARQSEPQPPDDRHRMVPVRELLGRLRHGHDGRLLFYMLAVQVAVQISGPYFTPYMLAQLEMSYANYLLLIATAYSARIALLPTLGTIVRKIGARRVLVASGLGIVPLSAMWIVSDSLGYLILVQFIAGAVWAAYELATFLLLFETIPEHERTSVLTTFNLANAVAMVCGSALGGWLLHAFGTNHEAYMTIFAISCGVRILTLVLLGRAVKIIPAPALPLEKVDMPTRIVAVRPNLGSIERPVLPGMAAAPAPPLAASRTEEE